MLVYNVLYTMQITLKNARLINKLLNLFHCTLYVEDVFWFIPVHAQTTVFSVRLKFSVWNYHSEWIFQVHKKTDVFDLMSRYQFL